MRSAGIIRFLRHQLKITRHQLFLRRMLRYQVY